MKASKEPIVDQVEEPELPRVKRRRRPWLWVVSVLLIAVGALLAATVVNMMRDTVTVVAAAQPIERGETIADEHLARVEVHPDPLLKTTPVGQMAELVGQTAQTDIPAGSLIVPGSAGNPLTPGEGEMLVGVALTPPQRPGGEIKPGQQVELFYTPRQGDDVSEDSQALSIAAVVVSSEAVADTNMIVVNVRVPADQAPVLASLNATGRIALTVKGE